MGVYEIQGGRSASGAVFAMGVAMALIGVLMLVGKHDMARAGGVFLLAIGGLAILGTFRGVFSRAPQVRATDAGVSFHGGVLIPWAEIKQIYVGGVDVQTKRTTSIAFDFRRRRTMFRLPIGLWVTSPIAVGDIDISPSGSPDRADVIASRLEAMRVRSVGTEDGVIVGDSELPAARVVERDRRNGEHR